MYSPPICRSTMAWADPNRFCAVHTYSPVSSAASAGMVSTPPDTWWLYGRRPPRLDQEMVGGGDPVASHVKVTWLPTEAVRLCRSTRIVGLAANVTISRYYGVSVLYTSNNDGSGHTEILMSMKQSSTIRDP